MLKRALFFSAFAALSDPVSRTYCDRKIAQGNRHNQALIALARRLELCPVRSVFFHQVSDRATQLASLGG